MFKFVILFLLVWSVKGDVESKAGTRIVGGKEAQDGIAPYQVSLRKNKRHFCGGSIINKNWIVSAAHCTDGMKASDISVVAGTNSLSSGGDWFKVNKIVDHEKYSKKMLKNDISVLKIDGEFTFGDKVKAINLASNDTDAGTECTETGWGYIDNRRSVPDKLQLLTVKIVSIEECNKQLKGKYKNILPVNSSQVCTFAGNGRGGCQGDSGGPLACKDKLVGVVSWGVPCAKGYPDVFTNVDAFKDWINDKISK